MSRLAQKVSARLTRCSQCGNAATSPGGTRKANPRMIGKAMIRPERDGWRLYRPCCDCPTCGQNDAAICLYRIRPRDDATFKAVNLFWRDNSSSTGFRLATLPTKWPNGAGAAWSCLRVWSTRLSLTRPSRFKLKPRMSHLPFIARAGGTGHAGGSANPSDASGLSSGEMYRDAPAMGRVAVFEQIDALPCSKHHAPSTTGM